MKGKLIVRIAAVLAVIVILIVAGAVGFVYMAPERATRLFLETERKLAGLERKEIDLPDGTHYAYLEGGQGEPLMLLHGFGANKDSFARVARFLTPHYQVIVPDQFGFSESGHPPDADYSPAAQAERLHALVAALGIKDLHLGGSSMGGQIAMSYAALYPKEVKSLWLLDPAGIWSAPESEYRRRLRETGKNPLLVRNDEEFAQLFPWVMHKPPFIPRPIMNVIAQERIRNFDLEQKIFRQISTDSLEDRVRGLPIPTLIVWGELDRTLDVGTAEVLQKLIPNSQVIILPNIGHLPAIESPERSAEDYLKFRSSL
ncbi:alpha/beta fold hydrolase [soil metagenome]